MSLLGISDGDYVVCVDFSTARPNVDLAHGDLVIIERQRNGMTERSCRQIAVKPDRYEFHSRSGSQTKPVVLHKDPPAGSDRIKIVGLVVSLSRIFA